MSPIWTSAVVFGCVMGGAIAGMALASVLPEHHQTQASRDVVKAATAVIGTMAALVLGLLVASAKGSYDTQKDELTSLSAKVIALDRVLALYGPETREIRAELKQTVSTTIERIWPREATRPPDMTPHSQGEVLYERVQQLSPKNELQRALQNQAASWAVELGQGRWLMFIQRGSSVSTPMLVLVVLWFTATFVTFGLFAPRNATVVATLFLCALSVAAALLLLLELDTPFEGLVQISSAPLRDALSQMGR